MSANALQVLPVVEREQTNLTALAREFLDSSSTVSEAVDKFHARVLGDPTLLEEVVGRQLRSICLQMVNRIAVADRSALSEGALTAPRTISAGEFSGAVSLSLLDYRIAGRRLGDYTKADLGSISLGLLAQADDMKIKSRWLALVAAALPDNRKTVDEVLTSAKLEELRTEARELS